MELTRDDILKMEAGPDANAAVAEYVMGFEKYNAKSAFRLRGYFVDVGELVYVDQNGDTFATFEIPRFTEDIAAAWQVAKKMQSGDKWKKFAKAVTASGRPIVMENSKDAAGIICRAALLAVMEK